MSQTSPISIKLLELHIADNCNLNCSGCSHFAPEAQNRLITPKELSKDLELAKQHLNPYDLHLLGGEPLLNPQLPFLVEAVRSAFPISKIKIVTNGILLSKVSDTFWQALTANNITIAVSVYPSINLKMQILNNLSRQWGVPIELWEQNTFVDFFEPKGISDPHKAFNSCSMKSCYNVRQGYLYRCSVSAWMPEKKDRNHNREVDGVDLSLPSQFVQSWLKREEPLWSCRFCQESPQRLPHGFLKSHSTPENMLNKQSEKINIGK